MYIHDISIVKMMWCIALTVIWYFRLANANGDNCLLCEEVARPEFCGTVKRCGSHEKCFIDTTVSAAGTIRYKLGCRDVLQCTHTNNTRKRNTGRSDTNLICSECCVGDLCNSAGCGNSGYPIERGPICFNCPQQTSEEDCSKIQMCHQSQVCMLHKKLDPVTNIWIYESKCENAQACNDEIIRYEQLQSLIVGKRQTREYFLDQQGSCLAHCCKTSLCNNNCNLFPHTTTSVYTSLRTTSNAQTHGSSSVTSTLMTSDACLSNPCQRGTCSPHRNTYKCTCEYGIYGRNCELVALQGTTPTKTTSVPHTATTSTVCDYRGKQYTQGQFWTDGCVYNCTCSSYGYYKCTNLCPQYTNLPSGCKLVTQQGQCCAKPDCGTIGVSTRKPQLNVGGASFCIHKGQYYIQDQTWNDGCNQSCTCTNADQGMYSCNAVCLNWNTLPSICHMEAPKPGMCCKQPKCPDGIIINIPKAYKAKYPGYVYV